MTTVDFDSSQDAGQRWNHVSMKNRKACSNVYSGPGCSVDPIGFFNDLKSLWVFKATASISPELTKPGHQDVTSPLLAVS